jgi:uncharacterized protein YbjT (DUF2867 family)
VILILGATGAVGGACVRALVAREVRARVLVRSASKAEQLRQPGLEPAIGDLGDLASLDAALEGVERALLLSPIDPRQVELQGNFIAAARRAGSIHVVKLSGLATALDSPVRSGRWHARTERQLEDSGLPFTHLRPLFFMQNLLRVAPAVAEQGALRGAVGQAAIAMVDVRDVAAVACAALTEAGHRGCAYTLTGPEAVSYPELAERLSRATGRAVRYEELSPRALRAGLVASGMPGWHADILMEFALELRRGAAAEVDDSVERVTCRPPRRLDAWLAEHAEAFGRGRSASPTAPSAS